MLIIISIVSARSPTGLKQPVSKQNLLIITNEKKLETELITGSTYVVVKEPSSLNSSSSGSLLLSGWSAWAG